MSEAHGAGLSTATAGIAASFLVTARDEYGNLRQLHEDSWLSIIEPLETSDPILRPAVSPTYTPGVAAVHFAATIAGAYRVHVQRAEAGGLLGQYYNNMWMVGDVKEVNVDPVIDFDWQHNRSLLPCHWSPHSHPCDMHAMLCICIFLALRMPVLN